MSLYQFLLVIHIACIAVWFGGSLSLPGRIRRGLAMGEAEAKWTVVEVGRSLRLSLIFGVATILSGLALVFYFGGFGKVPSRIHIGLGLTLLMLMLEIFVNRTAWNGINKIILQNGDRARLAGLRKRLTISSGVGQLLWLIVLSLMVVKG